MAQSTTRSLYILEAFLGAIPGIGRYLYDAGQRTFEAVKDKDFGDGAILYYEVAIITGSGSWWAPTASANLRPRHWPDPIVPLNGSGSGIWLELFGSSVVRPQNLLWWVPAAVISELPIRPAINEGSIAGNFPLRGPN